MADRVGASAREKGNDQMLATPPPSPSGAGRRQGLFTGAAAVLFCLGIALLLYALYHEGSRAIFIASLAAFLGTLICWLGSAASAARASIP
jgi:hypothetical protein